MKTLKFSGFVYQVVANNQAVIVLEDETEAKNYVDAYLKGAEVIILPIAIFNFTENEE